MLSVELSIAELRQNQPLTMSHQKDTQRSDAHIVRPSPSRGIFRMQARYGALSFELKDLSLFPFPATPPFAPRSKRFTLGPVPAHSTNQCSMMRPDDAATDTAHTPCAPNYSQSSGHANTRSFHSASGSVWSI